MRPDPAFPVPPPSRRVRGSAWPLRWFLLRRALVRLLLALGVRPTSPARLSARSLAHLDDRLLRDVGLRREEGLGGDRYREL
ncbi:DUF1127 domain-containing protein [Salinarimonas chemoclinalis]|uniref:DUF1127 domain-containing protein n=1 Tax=Salinarimonas chemoclinalis TaxID=3241599 RepID=UPI003557043E